MSVPNYFRITWLIFISIPSAAFGSVCEEVYFDREINLKYIGSLGLDTEPSTTLYQCALHCAKFSDCHGANWDQVGKICILFDRIPAKIPEYAPIRQPSGFGFDQIFGSRSARHSNQEPSRDDSSIWNFWNHRSKRGVKAEELLKFISDMTKKLPRRNDQDERSSINLTDEGSPVSKHRPSLLLTQIANQLRPTKTGQSAQSSGQKEGDEKSKFKQKPGYIYLYNVQCTEWRIEKPAKNLAETSSSGASTAALHSTTTKTTSTISPSTTMPAPKLPLRNCSKIDLAFRLVPGRMEYLPIIATIKPVLTERKCAQHCYKILLCTEANYFAVEKECELMSSWLQQDPIKTNPGDETSNGTGSEDNENIDYSEVGGLDTDNIGVIKDINCEGDEKNEPRFLEALMTFLSWLASAANVAGPGGSGFGLNIPGLNLNGGSPLFSSFGGSAAAIPRPTSKKPFASRPPVINPPMTNPTGSGVVAKHLCGVPAVHPRVTELSMKSSLELFDTRVVGGAEAKPHSWPWQAGLLFLGSQICGGSIIGDRHVLTAAHCLVKNRIARNYKVMLGAHTRSGILGGERTIVNVEKIFLHESYNKPRHAFDVAVLKLENPISFTRHISPICLAQRDAISGTQCVTSGWGSTQGTGDSTRLQQVIVPVVDNAVCNDSSHYFGRIHPAMLCAGYDEGGKDSCKGDSGGPLMCPSGPNRWEQHGIVSWGFGCGQINKPGVYARVTEVKHWILEQMAKS